MSRCVVLTPAEQAETGFYGRIHGVDGDLGITNEDGWTWLTFPEWKEVIRATRSQFAAEDAVLAQQQQGVKSALCGSRR